jgi:hypothetical protein
LRRDTNNGALHRGIHLGPTELWANSLPYLMTIIVLVLVSASSTRRWLGAPAALVFRTCAKSAKVESSQFDSP